MAKYKCTKDFYYHDTLMAAKGDIVEILGNNFVNPARKAQCTDWAEIWKCVTDGTFVDIGNNPVEEKKDMVNHPSHYTWLKEKCGIEVIDITRHLDFDTGNAVKYLLRAGHKSEEGMTDKEKTIQDLKKAAWYINDRIKTIENGN